MDGRPPGNTGCCRLLPPAPFSRGVAQAIGGSAARSDNLIARTTSRGPPARAPSVLLTPSSSLTHGGRTAAMRRRRRRRPGRPGPGLPARGCLHLRATSFERLSPARDMSVLGTAGPSQGTASRLPAPGPRDPTRRVLRSGRGLTDGSHAAPHRRLPSPPAHAPRPQTPPRARLPLSRRRGRPSHTGKEPEQTRRPKAGATTPTPLRLGARAFAFRLQDTRSQGEKQARTEQPTPRGCLPLRIPPRAGTLGSALGAQWRSPDAGGLPWGPRATANARAPPP